jgi:hypothetical protein
MPASFWVEWEHFFEHEHTGGHWDDWRAGMIAATIANAHRDTKKQKKPYSPQDFVPSHPPYGHVPGEITPQQLADKLRKIKRAHGRSA